MGNTASVYERNRKVGPLQRKESPIRAPFAFGTLWSPEYSHVLRRDKFTNCLWTSNELSTTLYIKKKKDYKPLGVLLRPVLRRSWHALLLWRTPSQLEELVSEVCRPAANVGITSFNGSETVHFCFRNWVRPNTAVYFYFFLYTLQPQLFFLFIL